MATVTPMMQMPEWDQLLASQKSPNAGQTLIFKKSPTCSISLRVENGFNEWVQSLPDTVPLKIYTVNVINQRPIARKISEDLAIKHESPQAYLLGPNGHVLWHSSHMDISPESLVKATGLGKA